MLEVEKFWRDGYLVIPKVLDRGLVLRWREHASGRGKTPADLLSHPVLQDVVLNDRLLAVARAILNGEPVYFGDSQAAIGNAGSAFHKDNSDRLDPNAPDWKADRYPIIRFGIYTKPHGGSEPGSIEFRFGSYEVADFTSGERHTTMKHPGDVVVWNGRTTHSGNARIVRWVDWRPMPDADP